MKKSPHNARPYKAEDKRQRPFKRPDTLQTKEHLSSQARSRPHSQPDSEPQSHEDSKPQRLAKVLAQCGVTSRRQAEALILEGRVAVNGAIVKEVTTFVTLGQDTLKVDGTIIGEPEALRVWAYYKPAGVITTHNDPEGRPTVFECVKELGLPHVVSVGRLDINSEGLLLLSNSGAFVHFAEAPKTAWKRCYKVRVFGDNLPVKELMDLKKGITIEGFYYDGIEVDILDHQGSGRNTWMMITLTEGKNREIRKVMNHLGLAVNRLIRLSYGPFELENLATGQVREISKRALTQHGLIQRTAKHDSPTRS